MHRFITLQNGLIVLGALALTAVFVFLTSDGCTTIGNKRSVPGTHGYRIYTNEVIKSFEHGGRLVCVPEGWIPVGAIDTTEEGTHFEVGKTGVLIKQDFFAGRTIRPKGSSYEVTILYPLGTDKRDVEQTVAIITRSFESVAQLYDDVPKETRIPHTVLVTAGILGDSNDFSTRIYPDPTKMLSTFVRLPDSERAEGLLLHAVMHLYNRFAVKSGYASLEPPFSREEFEELEATWAEVALSGWPDGAFERLMYLYKVHSAVVTQNPTLATEFPFNDQKNFENIVPTVFVRESQNYLDYQYGHYVLLPLVTAAIDGLLYERKTGVTVEKLLRDIHSGKRSNFMGTLSDLLPENDYKNIEYWLNGDAQIPIALIETAIRKVY